MHYFDTSALVKLVIDEAESVAMRELVRSIASDERVTSALSRAELLRAAGRYDEAAQGKARVVLARLDEITVTQARLDRAGVLVPRVLRTPEAIHLATAMEFGEDLTAIVSYDKRMLDAAAYHGLPTVSPAP